MISTVVFNAHTQAGQAVIRDLLMASINENLAIKYVQYSD